MRKNIRPIVAGQRFGRLTTVERVGNDKDGSQRWLFKCDCGAEKIERIGNVVSRGTQSCGCLKSQNAHERNRMQRGERSPRYKHGMAHTPLYNIWQGIIGRCTCPSDTGFENYGARGVAVCERWRNSFEAFLADMGPRPSPKHSIDRYPNNAGNYEPGNCRWATRSEQRRNQRAAR